MKRILTILSLLLLVTAVGPAFAQDGAPPEEIQVAFNALENYLADPITFETISSLKWEQREFADASLGCPQPGQMYAQVVTPGYRFLLTYAGITYDYRVPEGAENADEALRCDSYPAQPIEDTPTPPANGDPTSPCGAYYEVSEDDSLSEIAAQCETTVDELLSINPDIEDPSLIYSGQRLAIPTTENPYNVSIAPDSGPPGTTITLTASGLPPGARVQLAVGRFRSEYDVVGTREVGPDGILSTRVTIPEFADIGEEWVAGVFLDSQRDSFSEVFAVTETALFEETRIYLVALGDEGRSGMEFGCGDSLVPVTIDIQPTIAPLSAALEQLLAIDSRTFGQTGLYTALHDSDLTVAGIDIQDGEAIINLSGDLRVAGLCDMPRIEQQLEQTALQYETIDAVSIVVNGEPLTEALR